ncbi:MAG: hypothetical protein LBD75_04280 [Candidatus Peribacteria bacterium]|nr:hypothetical protein [Candidatus Peribacteria bacterium]
MKELAKKYGISIEIVEGLQTPEGKKAYGMYGDKLITLAKSIKESTAAHELLHAVFDITDPTTKEFLLEGIIMDDSTLSEAFNNDVGLLRRTLSSSSQ